MVSFLLSPAHAAEQAGDEAGKTAAQAASFTWSGYLEAIGLLFLLLAVLCLVLWCVRRFGNFNFLPRPGAFPRNALTMEAQLPLGPRKGLMVVRYFNKRLLLGITEQQISLLTESPLEDCPVGDNPDNHVKAEHSVREQRKFQEMVDEARQQMADPAVPPAGGNTSA